MSETTNHAAAFAKYIPFANKACGFLSASPDPFHAVANCVSSLKAKGFVEWTSSLEVKAGGKYYYAVQQSSLVAFVVGSDFDATDGGFVVLGGHTDSPNLKVKPLSSKSNFSTKEGCVQLSVECYGGGLWHTWFDRDLAISGRVLVRSKGTGQVTSRLVNLQRPIARVPTLCIHLQTAEERKAFAVNKETHTAPIIGTSSGDGKTLEQASTSQLNDHWKQGQEPLLLQALSQELSLDSELQEIVDMELNLYDLQPASLGGMSSEFLNSGRLDNLATCFCAIEALGSHSSSASKDVAVVVLFDHEEVGSQSFTGAKSPILESAMKRIHSTLSSSSDKNHGWTYQDCMDKSFILVDTLLCVYALRSRDCRFFQQ